MASYTIEDIELIRRKSGISYQEAVALLDYHNGNVARALIDLERNGRILSESEQRKAEKQESKEKKGFMGLVQKLYCMRVKVQKGSATVANLSCLFVLGALLMSPWTVIISLILSAVLGYKVEYVKSDPNFASENLERTVRNAAQNAKNVATDFARGFQDAVKDSGEKRQEKPQAQEDVREAAQDIKDNVADLNREAQKDEERSYYQSNPAATTFHTTYTGSAPTIQVPVKVESTDGDVSVDSEADGHNSATIG